MRQKLLNERQNGLGRAQDSMTDKVAFSVLFCEIRGPKKHLDAVGLKWNYHKGNSFEVEVLYHESPKFPELFILLRNEMYKK